MRRILIRAATGGLFAGLFAGCGPSDPAGSADQGLEYPYRVATTVGMVTDIVREVAGDRAEVTGLIGEGVDPHLFSPTRDHLGALRAADAVFYSGLMLEGKMSDALIRISGSKPVFQVTALIDESLLLSPEDYEGLYDPHVWMDVSAWSRAVEAVSRSLQEFDPEHADEYRERELAYRERLAALHDYATSRVATIPERSRILITAHDAFNYFGRAYGIEVLGIQGISTQSEAGLQDINRLVDRIVEREVAAVFVESSVASKYVKALVEGARSRGREVRIGGELYSDAMGPPGSYEGTYIGMIDHNVTTIVRALGGEAPERGMAGRLGGGEP